MRHASLLAAPLRRKPGDVFLEQFVVDRESRRGTFTGRDDRELHMPGGVAGNEHARHAGLAVAAGSHRPALSGRNAEPARDLDIGRPVRSEEQRIAAQAVAGAEDDPLQFPGASLEPRDRFLAKPDLAPGQAAAFGRSAGAGAVADENEMPAPAGGADGKDILIVGGEDHKSGEADDAAARFAALESWIRTLVPELGPETHRWSGQVMDTLDYCGFIGREAGTARIFVSTGDSGQGMTHGVVASLLIPDLIEGKKNAFTVVYDPDRKPLKAAATFVSENTTAITNMAQYLAPGELASVEELEAGQGAIIRDGLSKIAAYRAKDGTLYQRSAVCTHLGCHLRWNSFETCWDCPCHGSHFAPDGSVLNGPAVAPLSEVEANA